MKKLMLFLAIVALAFFAGCSSGSSSGSGNDDGNTNIPSETVQLLSAKANADGTFRLTLNFGPLWNGAKVWKEVTEGGYEPWLVGSKGLLPAACKLTLNKETQIVYGDFIIADDEDLEIKVVWRHPITRAEIPPWLDEKNAKVSAWIFQNQDGWKRLGAVFYANPAKFTPLPNGTFLRADIFKFSSLFAKTYLLTCNSAPEQISAVVATIINGKGHGVKNVALDLANPWTKVLDNLEDGVNLLNFRVVFKDGSIKWLDILGLMNEGIGWGVELIRKDSDESDYMFAFVYKEGEVVRPARSADGAAILTLLKANAYMNYKAVGFVGGAVYEPVVGTTTTTTTLSSTTTTSTSTTTTTTTTLPGTTSTTTLAPAPVIEGSMVLDPAKAIFVATTDTSGVPAGTWDKATGKVTVNRAGERFDVLLKWKRIDVDPNYTYRFTCTATSSGGAGYVTVQLTKTDDPYTPYCDIMIKDWQGSVAVDLLPNTNDDQGAFYLKFGSQTGVYNLSNMKLEWYRRR